VASTSFLRLIFLFGHCGAQLSVPAQVLRSPSGGAAVRDALAGREHDGQRRSHALARLFDGVVSTSTVSWVWSKIKADWEAWCARERERGPHRGQGSAQPQGEVVGGESEAARRAVLHDLASCGLRKPELAIVAGAPGLEKALVAWGRSDDRGLNGPQAQEPDGARAKETNRRDCTPVENAHKFAPAACRRSNLAKSDPMLLTVVRSSG
jgi:hypothetical protein